MHIGVLTTALATFLKLYTPAGFEPTIFWSGGGHDGQCAHLFKQRFASGEDTFTTKSVYRKIHYLGSYMCRYIIRLHGFKKVNCLFPLVLTVPSKIDQSISVRPGPPGLPLCRS
jgi:hypothetical protein